MALTVNDLREQYYKKKKEEEQAAPASSSKTVDDLRQAYYQRKETQQTLQPTPAPAAPGPSATTRNSLMEAAMEVAQVQQAEKEKQAAKQAIQDRLNGSPRSRTAATRGAEKTPVSDRAKKVAEIRKDIDTTPVRTGLGAGLQSIGLSLPASLEYGGATIKQGAKDTGEYLNTAEAQAYADAVAEFNRISKTAMEDSPEYLAALEKVNNARTLLDQAKARTADTVDPNSRAAQLYEGYVGLQEKALKNTSGIGRDVAELALNVGNFASKLPLGPLAAPALAAEAAAGKMYDVQQAGGSAAQAVGRGAVSGAIEYFTEKIGIDNMMGIIKKTGGAGLWDVATQVLAEGGEEGLSYVFNWIADKVAGDPEAEFVWKDFLRSAAMGAASGGIIGSVATVANRVRLGETGKTYQGVAPELVAEGLQMNQDTDAYRTAAEMQRKLDAGKTLSNVDVGRVVQDNETAMAPLRQAAMEMAEAEVKQRAAERTATVSKSLGYGKEGARVFGEIYNGGEVDAKTLLAVFDTPYQAGLTGGDGKKYTDPMQIAAYSAGNSDRIAQQGSDAKAKPGKVFSKAESGFDYTNAPADLTQQQKNFGNLMAKAFGVKGSFDKDGGANYNAYYDSDTGAVAFAKDFGIDPALMNKLGSMDFQQKVERLSNQREQSFTFYVAHEIANHVAANRAPAEMRAFNNAMYRYLQDTEGGNQARERMAFYRKNKVELDTQGAIEEIGADSILMLYDGDEQKFMAAMDRVLNGKDEQAKKGARTWGEALKNAIAKLKAWAKKLTGRQNAEAKAEVEKGISELEKLRDMFETAVAKAAQNTEQARQTGATKAAAKVETAGNGTDVRHSIKSYAKAAGLEVSRDADGRVAFAIDGKPVTKVTPEHIRKNSGLGGLITVAQVNGNISVEDATEQYKAVADIMNMIVNTQDPEMVWAWVGSSLFSAVKSNADGQYGTTIDFTTVCRKTQDMITAMSRAMVKMKRGLTKDEVTKLQSKLIAEGSSVPCPVCYVFSRWAGIGSVLDNMYKWQQKYEGMSKTQINARIEELTDKLGKGKSKQLMEMLKAEDEEYDSVMQEREKLTAEKKQLNGKKRTAVKDNDAYTLSNINNRIAEIDKRMGQLNKRRNEIKASVAPELAWLLNVRSQPDYEQHGKVKPEVLFNLDDAATFSESYPLAWKYRTSRGPSAGKAILPYSDMRLGDMILGVDKTSSDGNTLFSEVNGQFTEEQMEAVDKANKRVKAQNLIGGQRFQSTSDFRYDYALDYLMAFFEAQALGSKLQTYTKIVEFADMVAAVRGDVNLSVMPKNKGYITTNTGVNRLSFSSVTGVDFEAAKRASEMHDNAQLILVGINDQHILAALEDSEETLGKYIGFVIPYHASGASINEFIRVLVNNLGENYQAKSYQDYSDVQTDSVRKNATAAQLRRAELRNKLLRGKDGGKNWEPDADDLKFIRGKSVDISDRSFAELREVELKALRGDKAAIAEYESWTAGALWDLYTKLWTEDGAEYGVRLNTAQAKSVMPHEYWNKTVNRDKAYINGFLFRSYCYNLGLTPRFSGATVKGEKHGDFTGSKGYWKTLIDRPMYNNDGTYRDQQTVNVTDFQKEMLTPAYAAEKWAGYAVQEPNATRAARAADKFMSEKQFSLKGEQQMAKELKRIRTEGAKAGKSAEQIRTEVAQIVGPEYAELLKTYGAIERGETPFRDIQVPERTGKDRKVSQTVRTILEAEATPDAMIPDVEALVAEGALSFESYTDEQAIADATGKLVRDGWSDTLRSWQEDNAVGKISKEHTVTGWALYNYAANEGDVKTALDVLDGMVRSQRNAAQALQATRVLKQLAPEAQLYGVKRTVEKFQRDIDERNGDAKGTAELQREVGGARREAADKIRKAYSGAKVKVKGKKTGAGSSNEAAYDVFIEESTHDVFVREVSEALAKSVAPKKVAAQKTFLQQITSQLRRFASEKVQKTPGQKAMTATELLRDYIQNQSFYTEAWEAAQNSIRMQYADDERMSEFINSGIGVDATLNPKNAVFMQALVRAAAESKETRSMIVRQSSLGVTGMANNIAEQLIRETGAEGSMADTIRDAAAAYVNEVLRESDADQGDLVNASIKNAMHDVGTTLAKYITSTNIQKATIEQAIVSKLITKYSFGLTDATLVADVVRDHFNTMATAAARKNLANRFKKRTKTQKSLEQTMQELASLGAFDIGSAYNEAATEKVFKRGVKLKVNEELAQKFLAAETQEQRDAILEEIYADIGKQLPSTFMDKWKAWRYLAMLGNARTQVRNVAGNLFFAPVVNAKNLTATMIESVVSKAVPVERTKSMVGGTALTNVFNKDRPLIIGGKTTQKLLEAAWADYANVADQISNGGRYDDRKTANQIIEANRTIFKNKIVEKARKGVSNAMEVGDVWFSQPHYAAALASYCKANDIPANQIAKGGAVMDKARAYAIKEAQKATYRDVNVLSNLFSRRLNEQGEYGKAGKVVNMVVEGILPFRKTPANILARGLEYSPLGLLKSLTWDLAKVRKAADADKPMLAAKAIDNAAAGLTGTGLAVLGLLLAKFGLIRGVGEEDEKEREFAELQGHQAYSMELPGGTSVTLDWLAPEALPFFVGVNLWELTKGKKEEVNADSIINAVKSLGAPMLELSCLQSLSEAIEAGSNAYSQSGSPIVTIATSATISLATQAFPTLVGQLERSFQKVRMRTYTDKNKRWIPSDVQYTLGKVSTKVPFWDYQQIAYVDAWGRTESTGSFVENAFNNLLNPAYTSRVESSDMEDELLRLYRTTGESSVLPKKAASSVGSGDTKKNLTAEEYFSYNTERGQMAYDILTELVESAAYKKATDAEKAKAVEAAYKFANETARKGVQPEWDKMTSWVKKADEAEEKYKIPLSTFVALKGEVSSVESLKDKKTGETISGSESLLIMEIVYDTPGLTDKQRQAMFEYLGVGKSVRHYNKSLVKQKLTAMRKNAK